MLARAYAYSAGGDRTALTPSAGAATSYAYDARGRLASVSSGATLLASYAYDYREQRVAAVIPGSGPGTGEVHYIHDEDGHLLAEHDGTSGAVLREYVWLEGMPLATVTGTMLPAYSYVTTGNLNEPLLLTDAAGTVTSATTRDPWGNVVLLSGGAPLDLGYPDQWKDSASALFQNWHRDYDPALGRYAQADPIGLAGGANVYGYVGGNPVNLVDPMGLQYRLPPRLPNGRFAPRGQGPRGAPLPNRGGRAAPEYRPGKTFIGPPGSRPTPQQIADARGVCIPNGETFWTQYGRQAHINYRQALGGDYRYNFPLLSGLRPDAVDWSNRVVRELKPANPRAIREGNRQLERYRRELETMTGDPWTSHLDLYRSPSR